MYLKDEIETLREQLNYLIEHESDYNRILELSIKLDALIDVYIKRKTP